MRGESDARQAQRREEETAHHDPPWQYNDRPDYSAGMETRMTQLSRREFLTKAAADAIVAGGLARAATLHASPLGLPIGSQTYPHRALLKQDFPAVLKQLAALGVQQIELCSPFGYADFAGLSNGAEVKKIIADHGLTCDSCHFNMRELRQSQDASIAWAHQAGITQMTTASLGAGNTP